MIALKINLLGLDCVQTSFLVYLTHIYYFRVRFYLIRRFGSSVTDHLLLGLDTCKHLFASLHLHGLFSNIINSL